MNSSPRSPPAGICRCAAEPEIHRELQAPLCSAGRYASGPRTRRRGKPTAAADSASGRAECRAGRGPGCRARPAPRSRHRPSHRNPSSEPAPAFQPATGRRAGAAGPEPVRRQAVYVPGRSGQELRRQQSSPYPQPVFPRRFPAEKEAATPAAAPAPGGSGTIRGAFQPGPAASAPCAENRPAPAAETGCGCRGRARTPIPHRAPARRERSAPVHLRTAPA